MFDGHREDLRLGDLVRCSLIGRHLHRAVAELGITSVNELSKLNSQHTSGHELLVSELLESQSYFTTVRFRLWSLSWYYASYALLHMHLFLMQECLVNTAYLSRTSKVMAQVWCVIHFTIFVFRKGRQNLKSCKA